VVTDSTQGLGSGKPHVTPHPYDVFSDFMRQRRELSESGQVVVKGKGRSFRNSKQGFSRYYLHLNSDAAVPEWLIFVKDVSAGSGRHTHQGGLVLYVTKGRGYSVFNGTRIDWKAGDLMVMPVLPGGVEHEHFPTDEVSMWAAFIYIPFQDAIGSMFDQVTERPDWQRLQADDLQGEVA
jgi:hypothetical protein